MQKKTMGPKDVPAADAWSKADASSTSSYKLVSHTAFSACSEMDSMIMLCHDMYAVPHNLQFAVSLLCNHPPLPLLVCHPQSNHSCKLHNRQFIIT